MPTRAISNQIPKTKHPKNKIRYALDISVATQDFDNQKCLSYSLTQPQRPEKC